ncbi:hypothetical protein G8770_03665 [Aestuariicella hydrocarbonica]|uniref:Uncharacterized protein n=1 Tax=Pseudomaricurvus hydrocarbonicus TaxID=1470433 RepID=A0A9E5MLJ0_9GAMM|nr:hypothetical protein [Aestuariicella hydrocarbonica]NHO64643.1 hypothetical protein [Aestuariicella hydrocarbonica]
MTDQDKIPLFPISDWTIGAVDNYGIIAMRLGFISNPSQTLSKSDTGRMYGLTVGQARQLAQKILDAANHLEKNGHSPVGQPH